jgi:hypothetical protein
MNFVVAILYAPDGQRPLFIARVKDRNLLGVVAERAIIEAERTAQELMHADPTLAEVQVQEAGKLRRVLGLLLQTPAEPPSPRVM